jgi:hypothetical protein
VDGVFSPEGRHVATAGGQVYRTIDGSLAGMTKVSAVTRFTSDSRFVLQLDRDLRLYDLGGKLLRAFEASGIATSPGESYTAQISGSAATNATGNALVEVYEVP